MPAKSRKSAWTEFSGVWFKCHATLRAEGSTHRKSMTCAAVSPAHEAAEIMTKATTGPPLERHLPCLPCFEAEVLATEQDVGKHGPHGEQNTCKRLEA